MPPPLKPQITTRQEELLWDRRILSLQSSSGLIQAVIFYLIKSCGVYQGKDLRQLKTEHVNFGEDSIGNYVTIDFSSVVCSGKVVRHYEDPNNPRSLYKLLKTYIRYLANEGAFLVRPISSIKDYICYSPWPLGVSIIEHMVQTLMEEAGQGSRYGNISASLLALDVLKSYGAGRHCLATWADCLGGPTLGYRVKVMGGKIPDCTTVNCRDLNAEAGLIMSHLLDPPYPSGSAATQLDMKTPVEESEDQTSELMTSQAPHEPSDVSEKERGVGSVSRPPPTRDRDRLKLVKRVGSGVTQARLRAGGGGLSLHKKQVQLVRLKSKHSHRACSGAGKILSQTTVDLTSESSTNGQKAHIKTEPQIDDDAPEVELDVAADLPLSSGNADETYVDSEDAEEPYDVSLGKGKRRREDTPDDQRSSSPAEKVPKIEQHFQELEASLCGNLESFGDGVEQREDITPDGAGEATHDSSGPDSRRTDTSVPASVSSGVKPKNDKSQNGKSSKTCAGNLEGLPSLPSPQKQTHLSLVSGLEKWLVRLKQRVNTGTDPDMNGLLLQATSQLKVIADKVMIDGDESKKALRPNHPPAEPKDCPVETQLLKQLRTVQHRGSPPQKGLSPGPSADAACESESSAESLSVLKTPDEESLEVIDLEDQHTSGGASDLSSPLKYAPSSVDLSPPVLSPHPPTEPEQESSNFLFKNTPSAHSKDIQTPSSSIDSDIDSNLPGSKHSDTAQTAKSSVPDLVKFLESANRQMQSLLSPSSTSNTTSPSKSISASNSKSKLLPPFSPTHSLISKDKITNNQHMHDLDSPPRLSSAPTKSAFARSSQPCPSESSAPNQSGLSESSAPNQSGQSWPVLRSVLEEALPPRPSGVGKEVVSPVVSGKPAHRGTASINQSSSVTSCAVPTTQTSSAGLSAQSGMYTFQSDHVVDAAFQSLTVASGDKRSQVFTFPDLPLALDSSVPGSRNGQTAGGAGEAHALRRARSELCLGDYLPRGAVVPASGIKVVTQQGTKGLEVVLRFDFSKTGKSNV